MPRKLLLGPLSQCLTLSNYYTNMTCDFVNLVSPSRGESHRRRLGDATQPNRAPGSTPQDLPAVLVSEPRFTVLMDKEAKRTSADPKELEKTPSSPKKSEHYSTSPSRCSSAGPSSSASRSLNSFRDPLIVPFLRGYQPVFR